MIFVVGGNGGGGGLLLSLLLMAAFVVVPFLMLRGVARRAVAGSGGWAPIEPGWQQQSAGGWEPPREPVLPAVSPADVVSLRDRLGHDVRSLEPGDDPVARQAMADASERYATCSTLLEQADSQARLRTAWLAAVEGLTASRLVRSRLGLDPGPQIPLPPAGPQLQGPSRLDVGGRTYVGGPAYEPGRPHWFPGGAYAGRYVPGGWYDTPFWPGSVLLGALGGLALGSALTSAMYADDLYAGAGYGGLDGGTWADDSSWGDSSWGDGGFGGGGDWGSSGGWGGDGGGGDFGGGGGDGGSW